MNCIILRKAFPILPFLQLLGRQKEETEGKQREGGTEGGRDGGTEEGREGRREGGLG